MLGCLVVVTVSFFVSFVRVKVSSRWLGWLGEGRATGSLCHGKGCGRSVDWCMALTVVLPL